MTVLRRRLGDQLPNLFDCHWLEIRQLLRQTADHRRWIGVGGTSTNLVNFSDEVTGKIIGSVDWSLLFTLVEQQTELAPQLSGVIATLRYGGPPVVFRLTTEESPLFLELMLPGGPSCC